MKSQLIFIAGLLLLFASASSATSERLSSDKTISICPIEYTAAGKTARWHFNFTYSIVTDANGTVSNVADLRTTKAPAFVNETGMIECIKTWKLVPQGQYVVLFSIGTTGDRNFMSIVDSNHNAIKLLLS